MSRVCWLPVRALAFVGLAGACSPASSTSTPPPSSPPVADTNARDSPTSAPSPAERPRPPGAIFRSELRRATNNGHPGYLLAQLAPEVHRPNGSFLGWRVTRIFPDDPGLCTNTCDLAVGDVILTVNGSPIERPEQLSALVASIDAMEQLAIRIIRDGTLRETVYPIVDD